MKKRVRLQINIKSSAIDDNGRLTKDAFEWNHLDGMHMFSSNNWEVRMQDLVKMGVADLQETVDLQDKKIYRYPRLDLPRQKVDLLKDKFNCKVIRNISKADISIVSMKFFDKLVTREWKSSLAYVDCYRILAELKNMDTILISALEIFLILAMAQTGMKHRQLRQIK